MPGRWMEDRDRDWRGRDWRSESDWRDHERERGRWSTREERSFGGEGARFEEPGRDRVFGEIDTGAGYNTRNQPRPGGGGYGAGGAYGRDESYGRGAGGGPDYELDYGGRPAWQDRDYGGVSPAMEHGEYEAERRARRFQSQDYTRGGRYYGDDAREPIFREEYGQGGRDYGPAPRGYDTDRMFRREEGLYGAREIEGRYADEMRRPVSGGTGGYDFAERGYGDAGRTERRDFGRDDWQRRDYEGVSPAMRQGEYEPLRGGRERYGEAGPDERERGRGRDFLQRVTSWIGGAVGEVRRDLAGERGGRRGMSDDWEPRRYAADFGREARWTEPGHRGRGPKGYTRSDERISDEVHQRLTDDPWVDASNVSVSVSGGEVTLSGTVESREAKHRAERCVEDISGVTHVQNNLRVDRGGFFTSPERGFGDSAVEAKMREGENGGGTKPSTDESAATRTTTRRT